MCSSDLAAASGAPRFDYDPVALTPKGLLIEETRTNSITYSNDYTNVIWQKNNCTITASATNSPDGTANASAIYETAVTGEHQIANAAPTFSANTAWTLSAFVKPIGGRNCTLFWYTNSINTVLTATFDITAGTIVTAATASGSAPPTNISASITASSNGFYRVSITGTTAATAGAGAVRIHAASGTSNNYAGDVTKGIYCFGAQLEAGAFPTSYIPTVAATVQRGADNASMTGTNFSSWYNTAQGTFFAKAQGLYNTATSNGARYVLANTPSNAYYMYTNQNDTNIRSYDGANNLSAAVSNFSSINKFASAWSGSDRKSTRLNSSH